MVSEIDYALVMVEKSNFSEFWLDVWSQLTDLMKNYKDRRGEWCCGYNHVKKCPNFNVQELLFA